MPCIAFSARSNVELSTVGAAWLSRPLERRGAFARRPNAGAVGFGALDRAIPRTESLAGRTELGSALSATFLIASVTVPASARGGLIEAPGGIIVRPPTFFTLTVIVIF